MVDGDFFLWIGDEIHTLTLFDQEWCGVLYLELRTLDKMIIIVTIDNIPKGGYQNIASFYSIL